MSYFQWFKTDPDTPNPNLFTTGFKEGRFEFCRGRQFLSLEPATVARLIDTDDFYDAIHTLLLIDKNVDSLAEEIVRKMNEETLFVKLHSFGTKDGETWIQIVLDLHRLRLAPVDVSLPITEYGFYLHLDPFNLDMQKVLDRAASQFDYLMGRPNLQPVLE